MLLEFKGDSLIVTRELGDAKIYGVVGGKGESRLLYKIKQYLNLRGFNLKKIRMYTDGHLVDDIQQYLTAKDHWCDYPHISIWNPFFNIKGAEESYNRDGKVVLKIEYNIFNRNDRNGGKDDKAIVECLMDSYGKPLPKTVVVWNKTYSQTGKGKYPYHCEMRNKYPDAMIYQNQDKSNWLSEKDFLFLTRDRSLDTYE